MKKFYEIFSQDVQEDEMTLVDAVVYGGVFLFTMLAVMLLAGVIERLTA